MKWGIICRWDEKKNKRNEMAAICANVKPTFSNTAWIREYIENSNL
jgi:hypothetical protein